MTRALGFVLAGALACAGEAPQPKSPALEHFECKVAVLAPVVGEAAVDLVPAILSGDVNPLRLLSELGLTPGEIVDLAEAFKACGDVDAEDAPELLGT